MLLVRCEIGGVELIGSLLVKPTRLRFTALGEVSTATLEFIGIASTLGPILVPGASVTLASGAGAASGLWGEAIAGETVFGESTGTASGEIFIGTVTSVDTKAVVVAASGTGYTRFTCQCQGKEASLLDTMITADAIYSSQPDSTIIAAIFSAYLPGISTANVTGVASLNLTVRQGWTIRQFLDEVISRVSAIYYVSGSALYYHSEAYSAAPFNVKELQDAGGGDIAPLWSNFSHTSSWSNRANRVTVLGAVGNGGVRHTATVNDGTSQGTYGIISRTIVDGNINGTAEATARGNVELANYANPQVSGRFATRTDGFSVGQSITITMPSEVIDEACFIRSVEWQWETPSDTTYTIEYGQFSANLIRRLNRVVQDAREKPFVPYAIPAPLSIVPGSFASTLQEVRVVNSLPTLPDAGYPVGTMVVVTTSGKLWTNIANVWVAAADLVLTADSVVAGTIAAGAIRAEDAAFAAAAIQTADIANAAITTAKIANANITTALIGDAQITTAKIANLAVEAAQIGNATITGAKIANATIAAANIVDATITGAKIASATITAANIANATITDALIANATITSAKIASLDASKINAGTITVGSGGLTLTGTGGLIIAGGGIMQVAGAATFLGSVSVPSGGSVSISGGGSLNISGNPAISSSNQFVGSGGVAVGLVDASVAFQVSGTTVINSSRHGTFVKVNVASLDVIDTSGNIISKGGFYVNNGTTYTGQTGTFGPGGTSYTNLIFQGGILVSWS